ncbi:MAG: hypothetical protein ACK5QW_05395 [Cyanobacteriota bacterium]
MTQHPSRKRQLSAVHPMAFPPHRPVGDDPKPGPSSTTHPTWDDLLGQR